MLKKIGYLALAALVIIQFFRPEKNLGATGNASPNYIAKNLTLPSNVETVLQTSCYDCHSNQTQYPWYANFQPVAWWLADHVNEGKKELNFDEFAKYSLRRQYHKLEEVAEQVEHDEMPLQSYTIVHGDAKLSPDQQKLLIDWSASARKQMEQTYPMDSLIRKK
jgi:hypothetical protein